MIDRAKLDALSLATLTALKKSVDDAMKRKQRNEIGYGSIVNFTSSKGGGLVRVFVENFGPKNLLGYRIDKDGNHLRNSKWRVHPSLVTVEPKDEKPIRINMGTAQDRPMGAGAGAF